MFLPHSSASSERVFSMLKKIYTDTRSRLNKSTITSLLSVKINTPQCCNATEFSDVITKIKRSAGEHNMSYKRPARPDGAEDGDDVVIESGEEDEVMEVV